MLAIVLGRMQKWMVVCALVMSIGGHWALLQTVAWVGMTVAYSKHGSLSEALDKTFDGHHPCKLCKVVRAGKSAEHSTDLKIDLKKIDLISDSRSLFSFDGVVTVAFSFSPRSVDRTDVPLLRPPIVV